MAISENTRTTEHTKNKKGVWYGLKNTSFGESRFYLFEYGLLLALTGGLLYIVISMIQAFYSTSYFMLPYFAHLDADILMLSALTVVLPLVIILIQRTAEVERHSSSVKNLPWRKTLLGVFLAVVSLWALVSSILFINSILVYLSNGMLTSTDFEWQVTLTYLVATILLALTAWTFGNDYRHVAHDHFAALRHFYRYGLVIIAVAVGLLFLFFPFRENRTAYLDQQIVNDLHDLSAEVEDYRAENRRLPGGLADLSLSEEQTERAALYNYTYELKTDASYSLCGNFTLPEDGGDTPVSSVDQQVYSPIDGISCFDFTQGSSSAAETVPDSVEAGENSAASTGDEADPVTNDALINTEAQ